MPFRIDEMLVLWYFIGSNGVTYVALRNSQGGPMLILSLLASLVASANAGMCAADAPAFLSGVVVTSDGTASVAHHGEGYVTFTDVSVRFLTNAYPYIYWVGVDNQVFDSNDILGNWTVTAWSPVGLSKPYGQEVIILSNVPIKLDQSSKTRLVAIAEDIRRNDKSEKNGPCFAEVEGGLWAMTFNSNPTK